MSAVLESIARTAGLRPHAPALTGNGHTTTYADLVAIVAERADALRRTGASVLALSADNSPDWVLTDLAARSAGIVVVPIPQFFSARQKLHVLADSGAELIIAHQSEVESLLLDVVPVANPAAGITGFPAWRLFGASDMPGVPEGTARISYTSGTTGQPKGVCIGQAAIDAVAGSLVEATGSLKLARHLCLLPLPTLLENIAGVDAPMMAGGTAIVPSLGQIGWTGAAGLDVTRLTALVSWHEPDSIILVPEMLRGLLAAIGHGWRPPQSLRFVAVGGGRVAPALLEQAAGAGLPVYEGYGLTECASVVALNTPEARRRGSVGKPLRHANVRITDDGEIVVSGRCLGNYIGSLAAAEFRTGDLGHFDDDGFLYVGGRRRNVFINSFGRNISPDWVEPEFLRHGVIRQIAVFGEARPWNIAVIVANGGASPADVDAAVAATNADLPDYARVGEWLHAREPFSLTNGLLTANGRVRREAVFDEYRDLIHTRYADAAMHRAAG